MLHDESGTEALVSLCDMTFIIGSDKPISVMFTPNQKKLYKASLEIRTPVGKYDQNNRIKLVSSSTLTSLLNYKKYLGSFCPTNMLIAIS